jgi:hypothetical protein
MMRNVQPWTVAAERLRQGTVDSVITPAYQEQRAGADRERLVCLTTTDRF